MRKALFILLFAIGFSVSGFTQLKTYSFEEAEKLCTQNPRSYFIFIKTDWCKFCRMMEKSTFKNQEIVKILNDKFYFITLDAATKNEIIFNKRTFHFQPNGIHSGTHELALELANVNGEISYPTSVILSSDFEIMGQKKGFVDSKALSLFFEKLNH